MTTTTPKPDPPPPVADTHVAHSLPPTAPPPEPAQPVGFFKGLMLFWLMPRRYGPHLAVGSLWRAIAAHVLSVVCLLMLIAAIIASEECGRHDFSLHRMRIAAAQAVLVAAEVSASGSASWLPPVLVFLAIPAAVAGVLLVATALMPWCAGGDSAWSVWKRSVKNTYWSTTILIPGSVIGAAAYASRERWSAEDRYMADLVLVVSILLTVAVAGFLLIRMLVVGASRYVGEAVGPAFSPRELLCDECGYRIVGLPLETRCPECGLPVRDSLPGGRRRPTLWEQHEFRPRGFVELLRMQGEVLRGDSLFRRVPVQQGLSAARHFWWATFLLMELVFLGMLRLTYTISTERNFWALDALNAGCVAAAVIPLLVQVLMMSAGCLLAQLAYGIRDYRVSAVVCYYAAPLLWPLIGVCAAAWLTFAGPWSSAIARATFRLPVLRLSVLQMLAVLVAAGIVAALGFHWSRLTAALRAARHANV